MEHLEPPAAAPTTPAAPDVGAPTGDPGPGARVAEQGAAQADLREQETGIGGAGTAAAANGRQQTQGAHAGEADLPDYFRDWLDRRSSEGREAGTGQPVAGTTHQATGAGTSGPPLGAPQVHYIGSDPPTPPPEQAA
eukprot:3398727-Lingulodinium_polyedra.AAC.1